MDIRGCVIAFLGDLHREGVLIVDIRGCVITLSGRFRQVGCVIDRCVDRMF